MDLFDLLSFSVFKKLVMGHAILTKRDCMATADRAFVMFVKEFQCNQQPRPLQNGLIHHSPKINYIFKISQ